jgi:D-alanyl-D-alanine dipeptidase
VPRTLPIESVPGHPDFVPLGTIAGLRVDLRYATPANFVGADMYSPFDCAWIHKDGAERLEQAIGLLRERRADLSLLVLDALRPQRVQERMWAALEGTSLTDYLADPARGSIHSFGMAVDITLADGRGNELDMGTPFDDLTERSHPALEARMLASGEISAAHVANRTLLREVMNGAGWRGISREWWHFDGGDRDKIRAEYFRVL